MNSTEVETLISNGPETMFITIAAILALGVVALIGWSIYQVMR